MKIIQDNKLVTVAYESIDGVQFNSKEECEEYEKSAQCYVNTAFNRLKVKNLSKSDRAILNEVLFNGSDYDVIIVKPKSLEDVKTICQKLYFYGNSKCEIVFKAFEENKTLCLAYYEDYMWVHCIIENTVDMLNSLLNNKENALLW